MVSGGEEEESDGEEIDLEIEAMGAANVEIEAMGAANVEMSEMLATFIESPVSLPEDVLRIL